MKKLIFLLAMLCSFGAATVIAQPLQPLTFTDVCMGYTTVVDTTEVRVMCPGKVDPWMRITNCTQAKVEIVRPRILSIELIPIEENNIHGWVHYYMENPTAPQYRIVLEDRSLARRQEITDQFESSENLRITCVFVP